MGGGETGGRKCQVGLGFFYYGSWRKKSDEVVAAQGVGVGGVNHFFSTENLNMA